MTDERQGRPSASSMGRVFQCPGSWRLCRQLPVADKDSGVAADDPDYLVFGNACHDYMDRPTDAKYQALGSEGQWMVDKFSDHFRGAINLIASGIPGAFEKGGIHKEIRLWNPDRTYSGQADIAVVDQALSLGAVFDYKSGRALVDNADQNYQLRVLAVLLASNHSLKTVFAGIIQPRSATPLTIVRYDEGDLQEAASELDELMLAIEDPNAPLIPGDHCVFCPAKAHCPALGGESVALVVDSGSVHPGSDGAMEAVSLQPEQLAAIMLMAKRGRAFLDAVEERVKSMLRADPGSVPGWELSPDTEVSSIGDAAKAYEVISDVLEPEAFARACKVTLSKLEDEFHAAHPDHTKSENKKALRALLGPAITKSTRSGSLKRKTDEIPALPPTPVAIETKSEEPLPDLR